MSKRIFDTPRIMPISSSHLSPWSSSFSDQKKGIFDLSLAAGDILELAILPSGAKLVDATLITEGAWAALTAEVGLMTGEVGADTNADGSARTSDSSLFAAAALATTFARLAKPDVVLLARPENTETSVGVKVSGAVAKAAGKRIHLILYYYQ